MITDLIFDFFGTLVNYNPGRLREDRYHQSDALLRAHGFTGEKAAWLTRLDMVFDRLEQSARQTRIEYDQFTSTSAFFVEYLNWEPNATLVNSFADTFVTEWNEETTYHKGITLWIETLAQRFRLSISSNTHYPPLVPRNLQAMGIHHHFAQVIKSAEHGKRKPAPEIFLDTLDALSIAPEQALYIGDNIEDDYHGARGVGMRCILIDPSGRWKGQVTDRVEHLYEIERFL